MLNRKGTAFAVIGTDRPGLLDRARFVEIGQYDPRTFFDQTPGGGRAQSLRAAGYQCQFALDPSGHEFSPGR